ncbi:RNASEK family protein [Megaselia abdita]
MKICGPKCSICGMLISVWGVIQLLLMGGFYYNKSVNLVGDLVIGTYTTPQQFYAMADAAYDQAAYNCWIAAAIYLLLLAMSVWQLKVNQKLKEEAKIAASNFNIK